ncbi:MAG: Ig-like domain-containing protein [Lautropia sp.]|nr:Ig-like domain-containing protein [Lautropia sp.]
MAPRLDIYRTTDGGVEPIRLKAGTNKIRVQPGRNFRLVDQDKAIDPNTLRVLQSDNDLIIEGIVVEGEGEGEAATVVLENYYRVCSAADPCTVMVGGESTADATALVDISTKPIGALSDGTFVLHQQGFETPTAPALEGDFPIRPVLYGLGGAAVLGLALGSGGGGGDGQPDPGAVPLALKSATTFNNRFPTIHGTAQPGTVVTLRIDTDGDQREDVTYTATADAAGIWSVNLQTATAATGKLPATGLADSNSLEVSGTLNGVQGAPLALVTLTFDNTPPAQAEIDPIAEDNIITAAEKAAGVTLAGKAEPNGAVEIKLGTLTKLVAVNAEGRWSVPLTAEELTPIADGQYQLTATALDAAGNRGPAKTATLTINAGGSQPAIGLVSGNDIINAAEAAAPIKIQGTAAPNAQVELTWGAHKFTAVASAAGIWSIETPLPAGTPQGAQKLSVTVPGLATASTRDITVDTLPPARATGITISDGDPITAKEAEDGVSISGRAEANAKVTVTFGGQTQEATANAQGQWTVSYTQDQLPKVPDGQNQPFGLEVQVTDAAGNTSPVAAQTVTLEGKPAAPNAPTIATVAGDNIINAVEAAALTINGSAPPNATVNVGWQGEASRQATANAQGQWSIAMPVPAGDGEKTITATATVGGAASPLASQTVQVDRSIPTLTGLTTNDGPDITATERADGVTVSGSTEAGASVRVNWGGVEKPATAGAGGAWSVTFSAAELPAVGATPVTSVITATATDGAGNASTPATHTVTLVPAAAPPSAPPPTIPPPAPPPTDPTGPGTDPGAGGGSAGGGGADAGTTSPPAAPVPGTPAPPGATTGAGDTTPAPADATAPAAPAAAPTPPTAPGPAPATPGSAGADAGANGDAGVPAPGTGTTGTPGASTSPPTGDAAVPATTTTRSLKSLSLNELLGNGDANPVMPTPTPTPAPAAPGSLDGLLSSSLNPWEQTTL